jgi:antitoxin MazE
MQTRIQKWGNSLAVRIPKAFAEEANLSEDSSVEMSVVNGKLIIQNAVYIPTLEEMLAQITDDNIHDAVDWGGPVGKEIW